ncbi:Structural maintenance of chromosomes protein 6 [Gnomoniopsis smithogilvyi]|uniref:Structural maintenance of chromosomes protein 6 n=1 Tax=Gnomoniopsis smithogilvyi TaxID=1191159 RepID=A0A9W8YLZ7_9PEZI|nr:Structural maintenance of chromosomes protein 6 [Gnomoniopsis smithogilvyi]
MPTRTINSIGGSAARKRSRHDEDDNSLEHEVADVREASSSLQNEARHKRARISQGKQPVISRAPRKPSESSSEEDEDVVDMRAQTRDDAPAATQYEIMRDAGFEHLQHADEDDKRATQRIRMRKGRSQSNRAGALTNHAANNGILESITCINFMCHSKLFVTLGPNLNFIVGENGSGKSAILTAITLCLGGKASSTNRGGNMKAFIKEGQSEARLSVKIKNQGEDAYQHEIYGDTITVERRFKRNGGGGFRTFSAAGALISDKKSEVNDISEYYCLQVDNPLNVLSQDNARQFLNQASAKQKYKFFLQGVQLQQLDDDYRVVEEMVSSSENKEADLETRLEACKQNYDNAKRTHALYMESENMRQEHQLLRQKILWAQVVEQERKIGEFDDKIAEADQLIQESQEHVAEKTQELERNDAHIDQAEAEVNAIKEEHTNQETVMEEAQQKYERARSDLERLRNEERDAYSQLSNASKDVKEYEQNIKDEEQRLQDSHGDAHTEKLRALDAARADLQQIEKESEEAQQRLPNLNTDADKATRELSTVGTFVTQKQAEIAGVKKRLRDLEQGHRGLYDGYEQPMQNLLREIEQDGGFERKPVGPIGAHIQVSNPAWSPMLEKLFGENLNGFVVTNKRDQQRLSNMMNRLRITRSPILIGSPRTIDTSSSEPDNNFDTVLRILKIDDQLIRNQLIINNRIEKTILVESQEEADEIMVKSSPPRNVAACYHPIPRRGRGWTVRIVANANGINSTPVAPPPDHVPPRLQSDSLQETTLHKEQLEQLQVELRGLQKEKQTKQQTIERCRKEITEVSKTVNRNKQRARETQVDIDDIQAQLDAFEGVDSRLEGLRDDLEKAREAVEHYGNQYGDLGLKKQGQNQLVEETKADLKAEKTKYREFETRLSKAENKVKRYQDSRQIVVVEKNEAHDKHHIAINRKQHLEERRQRLGETVAEFTEQASRVCERVHIGEGETYDSIEKKLDSLDKALKDRERRRGMTDAQVQQRLEETKGALETLKSNITRARNTNQLLKKSLGERLAKWRKFQRYISSSSRANFMYLLSEREYRGKLILDHENHTLEVQVEPDKTRKSASARNTKTLSGGEKSFSSICLLLAIWEAMGSPLRCLDEFDVFMDNVNRAISTNMLVDAARNSVGRQFILITPNAIEGRAKLDKDVTITRMKDPRQRGIQDMI